MLSQKDSGAITDTEQFAPNIVKAMKPQIFTQVTKNVHRRRPQHPRHYETLPKPYTVSAGAGLELGLG